MSQHGTYQLANAVNNAFRADANAVFQAATTRNSGDTAPPTTFANMDWYDSKKGLLRRRDPGNTGWFTRRTEVASGTTIYVATDGDDTKSGLTPSTAFRTLQAAVGHVGKLLDPRGDLVVQVGDGTHVISGSPVTLPALQAAGRLTLRGNVNSPGACILQTVAAASVGIDTPSWPQRLATPWRIEGFKFTGDTTAIQTHYTDLEVQNVDFAMSNGWQLVALERGSITVVGSIQMSASSQNGWLAYHGGTIVADNATVTVVNSVTIGWLFGFATEGIISARSLTVLGPTVTGTRFQCTALGVIDCGGVGYNAGLPGNIAGQVNSGGVYI